MNKILFVWLFSAALLIPILQPTRSDAGEEAVRSIFYDTFYGMAAGALIGSAISLAQDDPNWGGNVGTGAAIGGIGGALFGIFSEVHYMVDIQDGKVTAGIPAINTSLRRISDRSDTLLSAGLLQYRF